MILQDDILAHLVQLHDFILAAHPKNSYFDSALDQFSPQKTVQFPLIKF